MSSPPRLPARRRGLPAGAGRRPRRMPTRSSSSRPRAASGVQALVFPELGLTGYTCGDLFFSISTLVAGAEQALARVARETASSLMAIVVGLPVLHADSSATGPPCCRRAGSSASCEDDTCRSGVLRGALVLLRARVARASLRLAGQEAPFGTDLALPDPRRGRVGLAVEICEDLWAPTPPSSHHAVAGATVILNPSASQRPRREGRLPARAGDAAVRPHALAYVYAERRGSRVDDRPRVRRPPDDRGVRRSLVEGERFRRDGDMIVADVDTERLRVERARQTSFSEAVHFGRSGSTVPSSHPDPAARPARPAARAAPVRSRRPRDPRRATAARCSRSRPRGSRAGSTTPARAGSSSASRAASTRPSPSSSARTLDLLGRSRGDVLAVTMPGFGTSAGGRSPPPAASPARGATVSCARSTSAPACEQHIQDIGLDPTTARASRTRTCRPGSAPRCSWTSRTKRAGSSSAPATSRSWPSASRPSPATTSRCTTSTRRAEDARAAARRVGGRARGERLRARGAARRCSRHRCRPSSAPGGRRLRSRRRTETLVGPVRAPRLLPLRARAARRLSRKILFLAPTPSSGGTTRRSCTAGVRRALLRPSVQTIGDARRTEGRHGQPLAPGRLADAERRHRRRVAARGSGLPRGGRLFGVPTVLLCSVVDRAASSGHRDLPRGRRAPRGLRAGRGGAEAG